MGQTIISAGLIVIVTIAVINANRLVINSQTTKMEGIARLQAADLAMELISEARLRKFDENADTVSYQAVTAFTYYSSLGRDMGETSVPIPDTLPYRSKVYYDDFDDFNGYKRTASTTTVSGYALTCKVFYSTQSSPDASTTSKQYLKTMQVQVSHPLYLTRAITISVTKTY